ncbi:recombinase family protein [Azotobacter armeniacus]
MPAPSASSSQGRGSLPASAASWLEKIEQAGAGFQSLTEAIDTTMQIVGSFAEFERAMLRERTKSGLDAARKNGRVGGRRPKLTQQQQKEIVALVSTGQKTGADAARLFRVHPSTVVRLLAKHRLEGPASA